MKGCIVLPVSDTLTRITNETKRLDGRSQDPSPDQIQDRSQDPSLLLNPEADIQVRSPAKLLKPHCRTARYCTVRKLSISGRLMSGE